MKLYLIIISALLIPIFTTLNGCLFTEKNAMFIANEESYTDNLLEDVIYAIENRDTEKMKMTFADNTIEEIVDFDKSAEELFEYYQGNMKSYTIQGGPCVESSYNGEGDNRTWKSYEVTYDIYTDKDNYRIYIYGCMMDDKYSDNIGIRSLYIIKAADDIDLEWPYWGDWKNTPGINIGIKNMIPEK